jgi:hypothetical protein
MDARYVRIVSGNKTAGAGFLFKKILPPKLELMRGRRAFNT